MDKQQIIEGVMTNWPVECSGDGYKPTHYLITTDFRGSNHKPVMLVADELVWKEGANYFLKRKLVDSDFLKELWI
jgi:hypothetical protein